MWQIAMSPREPADVIAHYQQLVRVPRKEAAMDALMTRLAARKAALN